MQRKRSNAGAICAVLVIVAMLIGIFIGILIGRSMNTSGGPAETVTGESDTSGSGTSTDAADDAGVVTESVPETLESGSESEAGATVLSINGRNISMEEINYYLYQQRDYFVELYGEDPWATVMDDGRTVAEYAKEQLYNDIVRTQILVGKAGNYGISLTDEMNAQLADSAQQYVDGLGADICEQFGLNASAIAQVYQDGELSSSVYNAVRDQLSTQMKEDANYSSLSDEDFENAVNDAYNTLYEGWLAEADIQTTDIWDTIVVGSVG